MNTDAFATKTERRERINPSCKDVRILGLDMGYSGPKGFHENGNFRFPNFCQKMTGELFGELGKNDIIYENLENGEKYYVGDIATKTLRENAVVEEDALFGRNHYLHTKFLVIAQTALGLSLWNNPNTDGSDIFLQTGLPPAYISTDSEFLKAAFAQNHHFAVRIGNERKEFNITLTKEQIDIIYQPMGTFYSCVFNDDGNMLPNAREYMNSNLLVFDGGFGTLDKFFVRGKQLESKDTNADLGMRRVLDETRKLIKADKDIGVDISIPAMQTCLKTGKITKTDMINLVSNEYQIEKYLMQANEMVREEAFESIKDYVFDIRYLIMSGGTGAAWYDYFKERLKGIKTLNVIPGNQGSNLPTVYSNARGYYMYRLNAMRKR